ncbi:MAG: hypothetical protein NVS4B11_10530 [Ktedonobacteraceae bacterium]
MYYQYCVSSQTYWISVNFHKYTQGKQDECGIDEEHATVWYDFFHCNKALTVQAFQKVKEYFARNRPGFYKETSINLGQAGGHGLVPEFTAEKLAQLLAELFTQPETNSSEMFYVVYPHAEKEQN